MAGFAELGVLLAAHSGGPGHAPRLGAALSFPRAGSGEGFETALLLILSLAALALVITYGISASVGDARKTRRDRAADEAWASLSGSQVPAA